MKFRQLSQKEKAEYIGILLLYPFILLFDFLGKWFKLFGTKKKQITASVLAVVVVVSTLYVPLGAFTASAQSRANEVCDITEDYIGMNDLPKNPGTIKKPLFSSAKNLETNQASTFYFGNYAQDNPNNLNDKQPIKWSKTTVNNANVNSGTVGAIGLLADKVLGVSKFMDWPKKKWKEFDDNWAIDYSASKLHSFLNNEFVNAAFNAKEKAVINTGLVVNPGGLAMGGGGGRPFHYQAEGFSPMVFAPGVDDGVRAAEATAVANAQGVPYAYDTTVYWLRTVPVVEMLSVMHQAIIKGGLPIYGGRRDETYGFRPMTRISLDKIVFASPLDAKSGSGQIYNKQIAQDAVEEYKFTLLDSTRNFTAQIGASAYYTEKKFDCYSIDYSNALVGENEYVSYVITDANDNILLYKKIKNTSSSGSFHFNMANESFPDSEYKIKVFNETINPGGISDISSPVSVIDHKSNRPPRPVLTDGKGMQNREGNAAYIDLFVSNADELPITEYSTFKVYTDARCQNEFPMTTIRLANLLQGDSIQLQPENQTMPVGKYYVVFKKFYNDITESPPVEFEIIPYQNQKLTVNYQGNPGGLTKTYTEGEGEGPDARIFDLPGMLQKGRILTAWYLTVPSGAEFTMSYPGIFNIDNIIPMAKKGSEINSFSCTLNARYTEVAAPVVNSVTVSPEGYAGQVTAKINATVASWVGSTEYSFDGGSTWSSSDEKVFHENTTINAMVRYDSANVSAAFSHEITNIDNTDPTISVTGDTSSYKPDTATFSINVGKSGVSKVEAQKDGRDWTDITATYEQGYTVTQNGSYVFRVTSGTGATATDTIVYSNIDTVKPILALNSNGYIENTWKAAGDIQISLSNTAANTSQVTYKYKINNGEWLDCDGELVISEDCNAIYSFKAISEAMVESDEVSFTVKRDTSAPEKLSISYEKDGWKEFINTITFGLFFKDTVTVKLTAADATSGVKEFKYTLDGAEQTISAENGSASFNITPQYKGNISGIKAIDNAGNQSETKATEYFAVDKENPAAPTVDVGGYASDVWTKDDVTFTVSGATADSGIAKYQYSTNNGTSWSDMSATEKTDATATEPYNVTKAALTISTDTNGVSYKFRAVSNAGNEGAVSSNTVVKVDKAAPTISTSGDTSAYKQSDTITVTAGAGISGISKVEVQKDSDAFADITSSYSSGYTVTANGTYTFRITNGAGVTKTQSIAYANIDRVKPVVAVDSSGYIEDNWRNNGTITLAASNTAENLGTTAIQYKIDNSEWKNYTENIVISEDCKATAYTFRATSESGVVSDEKAFTVKRDTVIPSNLTVSYEKDGWKEFLNTITFGLFFKDTVTVKLTATDTTSGVKEFKYTIDGAEQTINAESGSALFNIEPQYKGNISGIKAIDNAGNQSETKATEYFAVDKENPAAPTVDLGEYESDKWTKDDVTFTVSGATATSGIAKYQYSTDNGTSWNDMAATEKTDATATEPYNVTKAALTVSTDTNGVSYTFRAVSNAGNEGAASENTVVKVDKAAPTISTSGDTSAYKQEDKVTVTAGAGISGISKVEVKKDGDPFADITSSYNSGYTVTANGAYTFRITNGAGVTEAHSITYANIDRTKPIAAVDSGGYTEDSWRNNGNITLAASNSAQNLGTTAIQYKIDTGEWQNYTGNIVISEDCKATTYTFRATSESGVVGDEKTFVVKRDTVNPDGDVTIAENSVKKFINTISFGLFFKNNVDVKVTSSDVTSGVAAMQYYRSETVLTEGQVNDISDWIDYTGSITETAVDAAKFIYYVKVADHAGNTILFGSDGTTFDLTAPAISGITDGSTYYTTQIAEVTDANLDAVTLNGTAAASPITLTGNTEATYAVSASDKAENTTVMTVTMKPISALSVPIDGLTKSNAKSSDKAAIEAVKEAVAKVDITHASDAEKAALKAITDKCGELLTAIGNTIAETERITLAVNGYDIVTVKSSDADTLKSLKQEIKALTDSENLTADEKTAMTALSDSIDSLLKQTVDAKNAANPASYSKVKEINADNVKLSDKDALEKTKADFEKAFSSFKDNYTESETAEIQEKLTIIGEALEITNRVLAVVGQIEALPASEQVTVSDADSIRSAKKDYDKLSDYEKSLVEVSYVKTLNKVSTALANLFLKDDRTGTSVEAVSDTIFDPNTELKVVPVTPNATQTQGVQAVANGSEIVALYDISLMLNGKAIQPDGKVKITLPLTDEMKAMTDLQVVYIDENGKVTIIPSEVKDGKIIFVTDHFSYYGVIGKVKAAPEEPGTPPTGDNFPILPIALLGISSFGLIAGFLVFKKRKFKVINK